MLDLLIRGDPVIVILFNGTLVVIFIGTWIALSKFRRAPSYRWFWFTAVALLTAACISAFINMLYVGNGLPGNGWDGLGAAMGFFFSIPFLILDLIFLARRPRK